MNSLTSLVVLFFRENTDDINLTEPSSAVNETNGDSSGNKESEIGNNEAVLASVSEQSQRTASDENTEGCHDVEGTATKTSDKTCSAEDISVSTKSEDTVAKEQTGEENKWTKDDIMKVSRKFNLDLAPKVCNVHCLHQSAVCVV